MKEIVISILICVIISVLYKELSRDKTIGFIGIGVEEEIDGEEE